jgi:hypothetical protein
LEILRFHKVEVSRGSLRFKIYEIDNFFHGK